MPHSSGGWTGPSNRFKLKFTNSTRGICANIVNTSFQLCNLFCAKSNSFTEQHFFRRSSGSPAQSISQSLSTSNSGTLRKWINKSTQKSQRNRTVERKKMAKMYCQIVKADNKKCRKCFGGCVAPFEAIEIVFPVAKLSLLFFTRRMRPYVLKKNSKRFVWDACMGVCVCVPTKICAANFIR